MAKIWCYKDDCIYCQNGECNSEMIELDDNGVCDTFDTYFSLAEYSNEYYIAVKTGNKKVGKAVKFGKKIEINGIAFYTESHPKATDGEMFITHGRTGLGCGTVKFIKENFDKFMKMQERVVSVETLPLATFDEKERKYFLTEEV